MMGTIERGTRQVARRLGTVCLYGILVTTVSPEAQRSNADPQTVFDQATRDFLNHDLAESANGFDELVSRAPNFKPRLWQRGIVLYYAGRYEDCREQFESHRTVNPNDVENAAWHFLCVARAESPGAARAALLPVGLDPRVPMQEVYGLLSGSQTTVDVMAATNGRPNAEFFAHLYLGLYAEALGNRQESVEHIRAAASDDYAQVGGFMHAVARVHLALHSSGR